MLNPFKLFGKVFVAMFVISGYIFAFMLQFVWYLLTRHPYKIGDAFGYLIRGTTDTIAGILRD